MGEHTHTQGKLRSGVAVGVLLWLQLCDLRSGGTQRYVAEGGTQRYG